MAFVWLAAAVACVFMTFIFGIALLYEVNHSWITRWRIIAMSSAILFWAALTWSALVKFTRQISRSANGARAQTQEFETGQLWRYKTRPTEGDSRILIQRVEYDERLGEIVHIRVVGLKFKGPKGPLSVLPHLPYSGPALRKCLTALESSGDRVTTDYLEGYEVWQEARGGIFTADVASVLDSIEKATAQ